MKEKLKKIKDDLARIKENVLEINSKTSDGKLFMILSGVSILELLIDECIAQISEKEI